MDDEPTIDSGIEPDAPGDLQRLEDLISKDEAADLRSAEAAAATESGRDSQGRFAKGASANKDNANRAGERLTPEEIKAQPGQRPAATNGDGGQANNQPSTQQQQQQQPKPEQQQANGEPKPGEQPDPDAGKSNYRKENERRERSWQELNKQKEEFKAQQAQFDIEKQTIAAREQALRRVPKRNGFTAEQFEAGVQKFESLAAHYENAGDFAKADEQRQLAENARTAAADLRRQSPSAGPRTTEQTWALLKADLPEALNTANPLNQELRTLIQQRPDLLADEAGPFRVAVLAGRKLIGGMEQRLNASQAEAGKVPQLQAEVDRLSARVKELEGMTSPGGDGGGGAANRGSSRAKSPADMSTAELEASIERDLAGAY